MIFSKSPCFIFAAVLIFASQACNLLPLKEGVLKNDQIPTGKRNDLHRLTDSLFSYIKTSNFDAEESMLSADLLENGANKRTRELIGNHLKIEKYSLSNEYYIVNNKTGDEFINTGTDTTAVKYKPVVKEMYIAFYLPKESRDQHMVTLIYGKFSYGWRIDKIEYEPYARNGKTAAQLFEQAKKQYANGYLVDAINTMSSALDCAHPSEELIVPFDDPMRAFNAKVINEANEKYKFPTVMTSVTGHPAIFRVYTRELYGGTFPVISYLSTINIKDTAALKRQNSEVKKAIGKIIPGIDKDKKYLIYYIYNEKPNSKTNSYSYTTVDKLQ